MATAAKQREARYTSYNTRGYPGAYSGTAARQLVGEELLRPQPQVRPKQRTLARPRVRVREAGKVSVFAVVGFLAIAMLAVVMLLAYSYLMEVSDNTVTLRNEMDSLKTEEAKLRAQYELAYDLSGIETSMTAAGTMVKPQAGQIFYVSVSEPDSMQYFEQDTATGVQGVISSLETVWRNIVEYFN
ncbi:MAG: hypothetical protein LUG13_09015 [Oscillospiraceae bacterium]|nr:hypothetical protein [Oscillospiraceae bacterium]